LRMPGPFFALLLDGVVMAVSYAGVLLFIMGQRTFYLDLLKSIGKSSSSAPA
jgi:hypothetical protein